MLKETSYKEKFLLLTPLMPLVVAPIKKDLKKEHLQKSKSFFKRYVNANSINKATVKELGEAYQRAFAEEDNIEELGEFIANRWLLKHTDIYYFFEQELKKEIVDFTEVEELDASVSLSLIDQATKLFGPINTYLFSVINSVVYPASIYKKLEESAIAAYEAEKANQKEKEGCSSLEKRYADLETRSKRLEDKYEKKILGLERKYHHDIAALKKQVAQLMRKLSEAL